MMKNRYKNTSKKDEKLRKIHIKKMMKNREKMRRKNDKKKNGKDTH